MNSNLIAILSGVSTLFGLLSVLAFIFLNTQAKDARRSMRQIIEGEGLFNADQIIKVLSQFTDDAQRLAALKELTNLDSLKAGQLISKIQEKVDIQQFGKDGDRLYLRVAMVSACVFVALGILGFWYARAFPISVAISCANKLDSKKSGDQFRDSPAFPEMIVVPGGSFLRDKYGDASQVVDITCPFAVGRFEVTNSQWQTCVQQGACAKNDEAANPERGKYPVGNVSWMQAKQYVIWMSSVSSKKYRLLSEAEWEHAARSGKKGDYYWGSDVGDMSKYAWYAENSGTQSHPVGQKSPNAWGLFDVIGNVWEWTEDDWHDNLVGAPIDGSAWNNGGSKDLRIVRGGSFTNSSAGDSLKLWTRGTNPVRDFWDGKQMARDRYANIGFRVARSLE